MFLKELKFYKSKDKRKCCTNCTYRNICQKKSLFTKIFGCSLFHV